MAFVTELWVNDEALVNPTWEQVTQVLHQALTSWRGFLQMLGPLGANMIICPQPELGCFVTAFGKNELGEHLLIDPGLGMSVVEADLGGSDDTFPRCAFVDKALVFRAVEEFFESGRRATDLSWADPFELRKKVSIT